MDSLLCESGKFDKVDSLLESAGRLEKDETGKKVEMVVGGGSRKEEEEEEQEQEEGEGSKSVKGEELLQSVVDFPKSCS